MNLSALMNDGAEQEGSKNQSPEAQRHSHPATTPITNGHPPTPGYGPSHTHAHSPSHHPPSMGRQNTLGSMGSQGVTPLHTPAQGMNGGQYPFPQSAGAVSAGGRPPSHGWQYHHPSPSQQFHAGPPGHAMQHGTSSASPTPSSHPSQHTPHSVRQSPMSVISHAPRPAHHQTYPHAQHSQPSTPLGPPPLYHQRSIPGDMTELTSPYHQRTFSGASNGIVSHSPAINNLVESPSAFQRPSPPVRSTSEYLARERERERSLSVSPKTKVAPRPSLGSSRGSQQDHVPQVPQYQQAGSMSAAVAPVQPHPHLNTAREVAQHAPVPAPAPSLQHQLSAQQTPPPQPHPAMLTAQLSGAGAQTLHQQTPDSSDYSQTTSIEPNSLSHASQTTHPPSNMGETATSDPLSRKRPASSSLTESAPPKRQKQSKKYASRPPWAILSPHNPRYTGPATGKKAAPPPVPQASGLPPWELDPPIDHDLIKATSIMRPILGQKWEKTFRWQQPYADNVAFVQDWLYSNIEKLGNLDKHKGAIEIEAKIGVLLGNDKQRCRLPVVTSTIIDPGHDEYTFDSEMTVPYHSHMNTYLNNATKASQAPGRSKINYSHIYETDSFYNLTPPGLTLLPDAVRASRPRLRLTRNTKDPSGRIIRSIAKARIANLHIYNPQHEYDCRISLNYEAEMPINQPNIYIPEPSQPDRVKDRLSYKHLLYSIDLTRVDVPQQPEKSTYELEMEMDPVILKGQIDAVREGRESAFGDLVSGFLDNITFLMRERPPPPGQPA